MTTAVHRTQGSWQNIAMSGDMLADLETYETELNRWLDGKVADPIFTEFRLRHGVYGQRQDGVQMIRIKLPLGMVSARQLEVMGDLCDELADGVCHITTRQDIQYHNVDIRNTPELLRRLSEVGITTKEACGNVVRNVCGCTKSGVCANEAFDTTPDALALAEFILGHPEAQDFGRKFKISYSGCTDSMCGLAKMHDIGAVAQVRQIDGATVQGFEVYIGGGLGAVPRQGRLLYDFLPREKMFILTQAIARVFTRHGERRNRGKARFKFVVDKFGLEEIRQMLEQEMAKIPPDPARDAFLERYQGYTEGPLKDPSTLDLAKQSEEFKWWHSHNVESQGQDGYSIAHIFCPLGDYSGSQARALAEIARKYIDDTIRLSVEHNILFRWVSNADLPALYEDLKKIGLNDVANTLSDITACPGTDSCKLGISASRGLAATLHDQLRHEMQELGNRRGLKIKISGCPNSCGQHHIADLGFFGSAQSKKGKTAPAFQVVIGGNSEGNAEAYGLAVGKVSSHRIPAVIQRLLAYYGENAESNESFPQFISRIGRNTIKEQLADLMALPTYDEAPELYTDLRRVREFEIATGKGECAGELVPRTEYLLDECDRQNAQAVIYLDENRMQDAYNMALDSMNKAALGLLLTQGLEEFGGYDLLQEFWKRFVDEQIFFAKTAEYYQKALEQSFENLDNNQIRYLVEQATLFVEEANVVYGKITQTVAAHA